MDPPPFLGGVPLSRYTGKRKSIDPSLIFGRRKADGRPTEVLVTRLTVIVICLGFCDASLINKLPTQMYNV